MIREVMATDQTYVYHLPLPSQDPVYMAYPLEHDDGGALYAAHLRVKEILDQPRSGLPEDVQSDILSHVSGVLPETLADPCRPTG